MRSGSVRKLLVCFLAVAVFLSGLPFRALASGEFPVEDLLCETSQPTDSLPEPTVPETSAPTESVPETSVPDASSPDASVPDESVPGESIPDESLPDELVSEPPVSDTSSPEESLPEEPTGEDTSPSEPLPGDATPAVISEPEEPAGPGLYFGLLGAHSGLSEGTGTVDALFQSAAGMPNLDFFVVTDHSDSFDDKDSADIRTDAAVLSADWAAGKAAATAVTSPAFVGLFGYEMNWPSQMKLGHISTFGTPGFQSRTQEAYRNYAGALENYYAALASVSGSVSQFNHPGKQYGSFNGFQPYSAEADQAISLLELDFAAVDPCLYYVQALDRGWHLAPTSGQSIYSPDWSDTGVRTAVHAQSLTEQGILDALKNCRAYATEDPDLEVFYSIDGYPMGSRLDLRQTGQQADLSVSINDSSDSSTCTVEVITNGGAVAAKQALSGDSGILSFSLPASSGYYFLLITQADGDRAVTAPIWLDAEEDLGIASFSCDTDLPVQGEPICLTAALHNGEDVDFLVDSLKILADGIAVATDDSLTSIGAGTTLTHSMALSLDCAGLTEIALRLTGTLEGRGRSFEASLQLNFRQQTQVTDIAANGGHENGRPDTLNTLKSMAAEDHILFQAEDPVSAEALKNCRFLLVTAPEEPFSEAFLTAAAAFADAGGTIVLCGQSGNPSGSEELNRLLSAIGSTMRITGRPIRDSINNGGDPGSINTDRINRSLSWCEGISEDQVYQADSPWAVVPDQGQWLVKALPTAGNGDEVLLACETLPGGGTVLAAGSLFLSDEAIAEPKNLWDAPSANRTIAENLLSIGGEALPLSTIAQVRKGETGQLFRIRGYVTAGTSNPHNTFPDTLYLQDDTGGIAVIPFSGGDLQQGTAVEITGYAGTKNGNRILKMGSWKLLDRDLYQYPPLEGDWTPLLDTEKNGGRLVQVEGICREIYCREDDTLAGCLLEDGHGNTALILIEDHIGNSSDGKNDLHKTIRNYRTVRAIGLLHTSEYGNTVIRVRNCAEVVWVPPRYYWNPRTGDFLLPQCGTAMALSALGLTLMKKRETE